MKHLAHFGKWVFLSAVLAVISFMSGPAMAWHVTDFGDSGFLDVNYSVQLRDAWRNIGSGDTGNDPTSNVYFRRNRLSLLGAVNETFGFVVQEDYTGLDKIEDTGVSRGESKMTYALTDAYVSATLSNAFQLRIGKTKHVLIREVQEGCFDPLTLDRSSYMLGSFLNKSTRDTGVTALGNLFNDVFQYRLGVMEGNRFGDNRPTNAGYRYTARAHISLLDPETGWGYRGSYLGKKQVLTFGAGYDYEPNAVYASGTTGAENYKAYTADVFYEQPTDVGTVTLSGAYAKFDFGNAGLRGVTDTTDLTGERNGGYWKAAYMLGKVQIYGRYEKWSYANLGGVVGQELTYTAEGVNYYIKGQDLRLTLDYSRTEFAKDSIRGFNTIIAQFQARF